MKILHLALLIGLLTVSAVSRAAPPKSAGSVPTPTTIGVQPTTQNQARAPIDLEKQELLLERKLLVQQNTLLRESQNSILSTVYWSLGAVFGMAFLLAGFSWLNNHKLYSTEKDHLKREMESRITQAAGELQLKEQDLRTALIKSIDEKLESHSNRLSNDMSDVRNNIENLRERLEAATAFSESLKLNLESRLTTMEQDIDRGIAVSREIEEHVWQLKEIPDNILVTQGQGLGAYFSAKDEDGAKRVLARMKRTIESEYIAKQRKISSLRSVIRRLEIAQDMLPIETSEILQLLKEHMSQ